MLGVLLLRGAQTPGELKQRTERWHSFRSLDDIEADACSGSPTADSCASSTRRPGQKESRWLTLVVDAAPKSERAARRSRPRRPRPRRGRRRRPKRRPPPGSAARAEHSLDDPQPGDRRAGPHRSRSPRRARSRRRSRGRRRAQPAWAARPYDDRAAPCGRSAICSRPKPKSARRSTTRRWASRSARRATKSARCSSASTGTSSTSGASSRRASVAAAAADRSRSASRTSRSASSRTSSAWNYPYFVGLNSIVPALLTGNAVLYKPSEHATLTGLRLVDLHAPGGRPGRRGAGGRRRRRGRRGARRRRRSTWCASPARTRPGSESRPRSPTGWCACSSSSAARTARTSRDDVDVDDAALAVAEGAFYNGGQSCSRDRAGLRARRRSSTASSTRSSTSSARTSVGDPARRRHRRRTARACRAARRARRAGRRRAGEGRAGGVRRRAASTGPATGSSRPCSSTSTPRMSVMRDETFGPVIGVQRVRDDDEALRVPGRHRVRPRRGGVHAAIRRAPSASSAGSTSATPTGTRPTVRACACRGPAAATPASASRCPSPASAPSSAKRPGTPPPRDARLTAVLGDLTAS